jgi:bifunctional DNase/RNase
MIAVELIGIQVDPISGAAALVLREHDAPNRLLPIIVGQADASSIAIAASGTRLPRPLTHDLMASVVDALDGHLDAVEVTELHEGAFLANLTLSGPAGQRRIDTRPSDAIALAVRLQAPLFVSEAVLDEAGALPIDEPETDQYALDAAIDAEVDQFRAFLDELDPTDFIDTTATDTTATDTDTTATDTTATDTTAIDIDTTTSDDLGDDDTDATDPPFA